MYEPHTYATPQRKLTTGLPVGMVLLSMVATTASLLVGGEPELIPEIGRAAWAKLPGTVHSSRYIMRSFEHKSWAK